MVMRLKKLVMNMLRRWNKVADEGRFVFYTTDQKRFELPLEYLCKNIFLELFRMAAEEFGLSSHGPIRLPCDSVLMNYILLLIHKGMARDLEKALLNAIASTSCCCCSSFMSFDHPYYEQCLVIMQCRVFYRVRSIIMCVHNFMKNVIFLEMDARVDPCGVKLK